MRRDRPPSRPPLCSVPPSPAALRRPSPVARALEHGPASSLSCVRGNHAATAAALPSGRRCVRPIQHPGQWSCLWWRCPGGQQKPRSGLTWGCRVGGLSLLQLPEHPPKRKKTKKARAHFSCSCSYVALPMSCPRRDRRLDGGRRRQLLLRCLDQRDLPAGVAAWPCT